MKNVWLDDTEPIIPKRFQAMMQEKVDKCEIPSSLVESHIKLHLRSVLLQQISGKPGRWFFQCMPYMAC